MQPAQTQGAKDDLPATGGNSNKATMILEVVVGGMWHVCGMWRVAWSKDIFWLHTIALGKITKRKCQKYKKYIVKYSYSRFCHLEMSKIQKCNFPRPHSGRVTGGSYHTSSYVCR